jgi:phosphatidylinositol alpha-1,6-mannosyltransferase
VVFTGSVAWDEVPAYMDCGDVFAMPCRTRLFGLEPEAWGIVFLEAQACGLPILIGRSGGAPETLLDPAGGVVVDSGTQQVCASLLALIARGRRREVPDSVTARATWGHVHDALRRLLA